MGARTASALRLLIVDDDPGIVPVIRRFVEPLGFEVEYRPSGLEALAALPGLKPDVAMVDLQMPELNGIDVLRSVRASDPGCQVVLMTGEATVDTAIEAVKAGALDYLSKPFDAGRLRTLLVGVRETREDREHLLRADAEMAERIDFHGMIGRSAVMQELFATVRRLAPHVRAVLVTGESGTGKDLVARALHREGRQREGRFVVVDCSSVVDSTFDVELFGRAAAGGADARPGLFEHAEGGTLFLDDIGELPRHVQPRLLRAVEHGEIQRVGSPEPHPVDVCVMAASTHDLQDDVAKGRLRQDLFYRLGAIEVHVPSLRERREDVALLAAAFIRELSHRFERSITGLSHVAERLLQAEAWPGNVRELRAVLERACIESPGGLLTEREITAALSKTRTPHEGTLPSDDADAAWDPDKLSTAQREQIRRVLAETSGNKAAAAKLLGISRRSLYRWLDRLDLPL